MSPTSANQAGRPQVDRYGIYTRYQDASGAWRRTGKRTSRAIRSAMGADLEPFTGPSIAATRVIRYGTAARVADPAELFLEDGAVLPVKGTLPPDLPIGYHELRLAGRNESIHLIVSPPACYLPDGLDAWGWSLQLYALRSRKSWGIGDLADLRRFARWAAGQGAGALLINPLGAAAPLLPQQPSPYYPSSRIFRNPLYLRVEDIPASPADRPKLHRLAGAARALNAERLIDRDAVFKLKMAAFEQLWKKARPGPSFDRYCTEQGKPLQKYAAYCILAERHGADWRRWPARFRHPDAAAVTRLMTQCTDRLRFHQWLQWLLDVQLKKAARNIGIITDLPVGIDPGGADAWCWQDVLARNVHVGAPPDPFNVAGQDWGLQPFIPRKLRDVRFAPVVAALRSALRYAAGLRIDHVMGLFRLFWIPSGFAARDGTYVTSPSQELLAILAVESHRAKAFVVGEDLGTVEAGVRRTLSRHRVLGCRVMWFESSPPSRYPSQSLASVSTHDLPTIAGLWTGQDLRTQADLGLQVAERDVQRLRHRLCRLLDLDPRADLPKVLDRIHAALAAAGSAVRLVSPEDALGLTERPNMPGTTTQYPNWSQALPILLDKLLRRPDLPSVASQMNHCSRCSENNHTPRRQRMVYLMWK